MRKSIKIIKNMKGQSIILSAAGLKNIVFQEKEEEEFVFIIGRSEMKMNRIFAEFISPRVSHIHHSDPTINYLNLTEGIMSKNKSKNKNQKQSKEKKKFLENIIERVSSSNTISKMKELSRGERIEKIEKEEISSLLYLSILLNNDELTENLYDEMREIEKHQERRIEEQLEHLEIYVYLNESQIKTERSPIFEDILNGISINQQTQEILQKLSKEVFYLILNNIEKSKIDSDTLFDLINEIFVNSEEEETEHNIYEFYEHLEVGELSFNKFSQFIKDMKYNEITNDIWTQLVELLLTSKKNEEQEKSKAKKIGHLYEYDGNPSHRFEGIIQHLRGPEKRNPNDTGIINVTSSPVLNNCYPKYAVDFDSDQYFLSDDGNDWLKYDFKDKKIRPTRYSIKTRNDKDSQNPVNWCIEVSNTGEDSDWRIIDSRSGVRSVSKRNQSDTFDIQTRLTTEENYRYIRFRCTGNTSPGCNGCLAISSLEYFGTLID